MPKMAKWLIGAVLVLVLVPVIALVVITRFIDPNDYKGKIENLVSEHTRGRLELGGKLSWSFFPTLGVTSGALTFRLPEDGQQPFAHLDGARLGVRLLPLLHGQVAADTLAFEGLSLNLVADKDGEGNWARIMRKEESTGETPAPSADAGKAGAGALGIAIDRIVVSAAHLHYSNLKDGSAWHLDPLDVTLSRINLAGEPITVALKADVAGKPFKDRKVPLSLDARVSYNSDDGLIQLQDMALVLANMSVNANLQVHTSPLDIAGTLSIPAFNAAALLEAIGQGAPSFRDPQALHRLAIEGTFPGGANSVLLNPLSITLDDTLLQGQAGITNLDSKHIHVVLKGNGINLDHYQSAKADEQAAGKPAAAQEDLNAALLPVAALREQDFTLQLDLDSLTANGLVLNGFSLAARGSGGLITLDHLNANLYSGTLRSNAVVDVRRDTPQLRVQNKLSNVQLGNLLRDMKATNQFDGAASISADIQAEGNSMPALKRSLTGPISLTLKDGALHGVSLEQYTCQAIALTRKQVSTTRWPSDTAIKSVDMDLQFHNGVGFTRALSGKLNNLQLAGDGAVSLPDNRFDYHFGITLTGDLSGTDPNCNVNETVRDIAWPVHCTGTFAGENAKTSCGLDNERMGAIIAKLASKGIQQKLEEKLGGSWKGLKGLFGK